MQLDILKQFCCSKELRITANDFQLFIRAAPDQPCLFRRNDYTSSYANGDFVVRSSTSAYPFGGALVSTGMLKPKWQAEAPLASLKAAP